MNMEEILRIFCRLSGLDYEDAADFRFMCDTALSYIRARIKHGSDIEFYGGRINFAAAALAYYRYVLWSLTDGVANEINVGEIRVKHGGSSELEAADKLCRETFADLGDILESENFVFNSFE